jgi:hypothetical protein
VKKEWAHQDGISGAGIARDSRSGPSGYRGVVEESVSMRAGKDLQRAVVGAAVVQVDAHGDHAFEHRGWGSHVGYARLAGPRSEPIDLHALVHRDNDILMEREAPVRARVLVEQNRPGQGAGKSEHIADERADNREDGQLPEFWHIRERAAKPGTRVHWAKRGQPAREIGVNKTSDYRESLAVDHRADGFLCDQSTPCAANQRSASSAAMQPMPAAVTAWRYS